MADLAFDDSLHGQMLHNVAGSRPLSVSTMGESHGLDYSMGAAIQWACWAHYPAHIRFDKRSYADGGNVHAVGGTTTGGAGGLLGQVAQFEARPTDAVFICASYNNQPGNLSELNALVADNIAAAEACFAAGAKFVVIVGATPRDYTGSATFMLGFNLRMRMWCAGRDGAFFLDVSSVLADRQNATADSFLYRDIGTYAAGTYRSLTSDGTHWSGHALRLIAPLVADILRRIAPRRTPRLAFNSPHYDPVNAPYGNLLGPVGGMMGTAGLWDSSDFPGTIAGMDASSRIEIAPGGLTVTPSLVTGPNGERVQRLTMGGSAPGYDTFVTITFKNAIGAADGGAATRAVDMEALVKLTGIVGLTDVVLHPVDTAYRSILIPGMGASSRFVDGTDHDLFCYTTFPAPLPSGSVAWSFQMLLMFNNTAPSGTIDISNASVALVKE